MTFGAMRDNKLTIKIGEARVKSAQSFNFALSA